MIPARAARKTAKSCLPRGPFVWRLGLPSTELAGLDVLLRVADNDPNDPYPEGKAENDSAKRSPHEANSFPRGQRPRDGIWVFGKRDVQGSLTTCLCSHLNTLSFCSKSDLAIGWQLMPPINEVALIAAGFAASLRLPKRYISRRQLFGRTLCSDQCEPIESRLSYRHNLPNCLSTGGLKFQVEAENEHSVAPVVVRLE